MYQKIDKRLARKLYNSGAEVLIIPCKCSPLAAWLVGGTMVNAGEPFDKFVNEFEYYNCCYELGYYAAFYKEI